MKFHYLRIALLISFIHHFALAAPISIPPTHKNIPYGPHEDQVFNFWQATSDDPTPLIIHVHGGGWQKGEKMKNLNTEHWLKRGVSYASIDYRLCHNAILPAPVMDAARAIQFIRYHSKKWNIHKEKIALTGGSAGGCTSLWLACHDDLADPNHPDPIYRESTKPLCALTTNGQTSIKPQWILDHVGKQAASYVMIWKSVGAKDFKDLLASENPNIKKLSHQFSPIEHLDAQDPPIGTVLNFPLANTGIHSPHFGIAFKKKADQIGANVTVYCKEQHPLSSPYDHRYHFLSKYLLEP
jgi:acetyl esterase/lipase